MDMCKAADRLFVAVVVSTAALVVLTGVHLMVYNWVFLPRYFDEHGRSWLINRDILAAYWRWPTGRILVITNGTWLAAEFGLFRLLKTCVRRSRGV